MRTLYIILTLVSLLFVGCDETKKVIDVAGNVQLSGTYDITSIGEIRVNEPTININFSALDKSVRGNGGCNSFFGNYTLDLYSLNFIDIAATENYCDEPIMITERAIMNALRETGSFTYEKSILTLLSKTDRSVLLQAKKIKKDQ